MTDRDEAIKQMRSALKRRSGKAWSVTGGRGTAWGWITIHSPPSRREGFDYMPNIDRAELTYLLDLDRAVHQQGESIPAGSDYREEYVARCEGRTPTVHGSPYWD